MRSEYMESEHRETLWLNPDWRSIQPNERIGGYWYVHMKAAQNRYMRFLPYIAAAFPETAPKKGVIESPLVEIPAMKEWFNERGAGITGRVFLKDDSRLPIAGSTAGRGGIHEVLHIAEVLLQRAGMLQVTDRYDVVNTPAFREYLSRFTIHVAGDDDLNTAVCRTAEQMGFCTDIHLPAEEAEEAERSFLVDEENSQDLFFGYASAALRLKVQLGKLNIAIGPKNPLFLYIPCGSGMIPGGIAFGLRQLCGDYVHCFFAEPLEDPRFTAGRSSAFARRLMEPLMSGGFTVQDEKLPVYQRELSARENLGLSPAACAGFRALEEICRPGTPWAEYIRDHGLTDCMDQAIHIVWGTGGGNTCI